MKKSALLVLVGFFSLVAGRVHAGESSFSAINFSPTTDNSAYFSVYGSKTLNPREFNAGLYFDYSYRAVECNGCPRPNVIDNMVVGNFIFSVGVVDWFQLGIDFPIVAYSEFYDDVTGAQAFDGSLGDIRFEPKFRLLDIGRHYVGLALLPFITFPSGDETQFLGNGALTGGAKLILDFNAGNRVGFSLNGGYRIRDDVTRTNTEIDDELVYGLGMVIHATSHLDLFAEAYGYTVVKAFFDSAQQSPMEANGGLRYRMDNGFAISVGGGGGVIDGVGTPLFRVISGLSFTPPVTKVLKADVPKDTVYEPRAKLKGNKIMVLDPIYFDFNKATLKAESYPVLDDVAKVIEAHPEIDLLQVEGHTDSVGADAYNQKLSESRAKAAMMYLAEHGIDAKRLTYKGFGEAKPIATNESATGRGLNRRTEFTILVQK